MRSGRQFIILIVLAAGLVAGYIYRYQTTVHFKKKSEKASPIESLIAKVTGPSSPSIEAHAEAVWQAELTQVLQERNDNDARLDTQYKNMPPEMHAWLIEQYQKIKPEDRNQRGKIAFLISRDLKSMQDINFLRNLFTERPCLSLQDCSVNIEGQAHLASVQQMTLNYPQMAALYQIGNRLPDLANSRELRDSVLTVIAQARSFPVPLVQHKAESLLEAFRH